MTNSLSLIDQKILQLKQKKEKIQTQQAALFIKEAQKILGDEFSIELALGILSHSWKDVSSKQKEVWSTSFGTFRSSFKKSRETTHKSATANSPI